MTELVRAEREGPLLSVTITRPDKRNALSGDTLAALERAFRAADGDRELALAVLTGSGSRAFAAGGDLHELQALRSVQDIEPFTRAARRALDAIRRFPVPVVAVLNGDALGGGAELAVACDARVAAAHARIGFVQGKLAVSTAWGGGIDLMRLLGSARALELLGSGRLVGAAEALALGLVNAVAPAEEDASAFARAWCRAWLEQAPHVMRAFKRQALAERLGRSREEREAFEHEDFVASWLHADHWRAAEALVAGLGGQRVASE
ncbi:MAG: enoyl-CoA hydratase/isomerase family protein [Thermodesulfobacteriota bacterium]